MSTVASHHPWQCRCGNSRHCPGHKGGLLWREKREGVGLCLLPQDCGLEDGGDECQARTHKNQHSNRSVVDPHT